jgi:hypothetical protein
MTTVQAAAARPVSYQLDTLWDFDGGPTHHELESRCVTGMLIPRLERLGRIEPRVAPRHREFGLLD